MHESLKNGLNLGSIEIVVRSAKELLLVRDNLRIVTEKISSNVENADPEVVKIAERMLELKETRKLIRDISDTIDKLDEELEKIKELPNQDDILVVEQKRVILEQLNKLWKEKTSMSEQNDYFIGLDQSIVLAKPAVVKQAEQLLDKNRGLIQSLQGPISGLN